MNTRYEIKAIVCTNAETLRGYAETACSPGWIPAEAEEAAGVFVGMADEYALEIAEAVRYSLSCCEDVSSTDSDIHFQNWNGGKYSSQARAYGYRFCGPAVLAVYEIVEDEDGGEDYTWLGLDDELPQAVRDSLARIDAVVEDAIRRAGVDISHAYAGLVMQSLADMVEELRESRAD